MGFLIYVHTCVYDVFFHLKTCLGDLPMGDLFLPVDPNPTHCFNQFPGASWCEWTVTQHRDCAKNAYVLIRFSISYRSVFNAPYSLPSFPSASLLFFTHRAASCVRRSAPAAPAAWGSPSPRQPAACPSPSLPSLYAEAPWSVRSALAALSESPTRLYPNTSYPSSVIFFSLALNTSSSVIQLRPPEYLSCSLLCPQRLHVVSA